MNIFIAKLSPKTTDETLHALFQQYGEVDSAKVIFDRESGRSKCFGFVEMTNDQEASEAINDLDGFEFEGSTIVVKKARPRENNRDQGRRSFNRH
ncbi:MAG: RNA-binding protein [Bacteroidales bacterium]|nr:RNA-binding protein [Bacteroidales bacterium]